MTTPSKQASKRTAVPAPDQPTDSAPALAAMTARSRLPVMIDTDRLRPHPHNPRRDLGDLSELTASIGEHGVLQNLTVVPSPEEPEAFWVVIGHRRHAASTTAGLPQVPAVVNDGLTLTEQIQIMLVENLQRTDLSAVEEADGYQELLDLGLTEADIAEQTGRARSTVKARLKLVALPEAARQAVHTHAATLTDVAALDEFTDPEVRDRLAETLGTADFNHALALERSHRQRAERFKAYLDALTAGNATELPPNVWESPEGLFVAFIARTYQLGQPSADEALAQLAGVTAGWAWRWWYEDLVVYRPLTLEEAQEAAERDERQAAQRTEEEARKERAAAERAERAALEAAARELAATTETTRRDFLTQLIGRKLNAAHTRSIVAFAGFEMLMDGWLARGGETVAAGPDYIPSWVGVDVDEVTARAVDEEVDPDDAVDQEVQKAIANLDPPNRLLAALAAANEPVHSWEWTMPTPGRALLAWYALLEELGYVPSSAERAVLEPGDVEAA